jgi:hypothetical protein
VADKKHASSALLTVWHAIFYSSEQAGEGFVPDGFFLRDNI